MKNSIITLILLHLVLFGFSQEMGYEVRGTYTRPIQKQILNEAMTMSDINPGFPSSWITEYISAEIMTSWNGKTMRAVSVNDTLSSEQKSILKMAELGTDIVVDVKYNYKSPYNGNIDFKEINFSYTVVPEFEAEYPGGYQLLKQYLKENAIDKISETNAGQLPSARVRFTINEEGEIIEAQISKTSEDEKIDKLLLEAISKMPKWSPAQNSDGIKVKQEFEFSIGIVGC